MNSNLANSLNKEIDRHAEGDPLGKLESHDMGSLSRRLLAPRAVVEKLLATGALRSEGPTYFNDPTGRHAFSSDSLNQVKRAVLFAVVEMTIEKSDSASLVAAATRRALSLHHSSFSKTSGNERPLLARFLAGLVQLSRYDGRDDEPGLAERTATVGKVAAVGGLAYGAAALLRGRKLNPGAGVLNQVRQGGAANIATVRAIGSRLSAGAAKVAAVVRGQLRR